MAKKPSNADGDGSKPVTNEPPVTASAPASDPAPAPASDPAPAPAAVVPPDESIVTGDASKPAPAAESTASTVATTADLLGNLQAAEKVTPIPLPPQTPATAATATEETKGCQCKRCKETGGNKDKRGRHHATCPCAACCEARGEAPPAPAATTAPAAATSDNPFAAVQAVGDAAALAVDQSKQFEVMGQMTFDVSTGALSTIFGPEWQPKNPDERLAVSQAFAEYYRIKGIKDLPPGWMLLAVCLAYSAPRLGHNNTRSKLVLAWQWTKVKVGGLFHRFFRRK